MDYKGLIVGKYKFANDLAVVEPALILQKASNFSIVLSVVLLLLELLRYLNKQEGRDRNNIGKDWVDTDFKMLFLQK